MQLRFDIRRFAVIVLTFAVASAVLGPACLFGPTSAFAASMPDSMDAPARDCDDSEPMVACPHEGDAVILGVPQDHVRASAEFVPAAASTVQKPVALSPLVSFAADPPTVVVPQLTPLRL